MSDTCSAGRKERGLYGARKFAAHLAGKNFKGMVLSVDMVGVGWKLRAINGAGTLFRLETNREVLELLNG
ncbi:MAG: hypothetical protein AB9891_02190 [Anaerolineaceae bacterium]